MENATKKKDPEDRDNVTIMLSKVSIYSSTHIPPT